MMATFSAAASAADYSAADARNNEIVLDGVKDDAYVCTSIMADYPGNAENLGGRTDENYEGATAEAYVAWDDEYLYVYCEVIDEAVTPAEACLSSWSDDAIEVFINLSGTEGDYRNEAINAGQYTIGPNFVDWGGGGYHQAIWKYDSPFKWVMTDTGYIMEVAIAWGDEYSPIAGDEIYFLLSVNDSVDGDPANREYRCNNTEFELTEAWYFADFNWTTLELSKEAYVAGAEAPAVEEAPAEEAVSYADAANGVIEATEGNAGETADMLFDGDENTKWCLAGSDAYVIWKTDAVTATGYEIVTANDNASYPGRNPTVWTLSGSNDGENWTVIDAVEGDTTLQDVNFTPFTFDIDAPAEYTIYKLEVSGFTSGTLQISGLNLLTGDAAASESAAEEVVEEAPAEEVVEEVAAPQTFDAGVIAAVAAIVSAAGYALSKKH